MTDAKKVEIAIRRVARDATNHDISYWLTRVADEIARVLKDDVGEP